MSYLADAHSEWHAVHGAYAICPLDCGAMSPEQAEAEEADNTMSYYDEHGTASITCGACGGTHKAVDAVKACYFLQGL